MDFELRKTNAWGICPLLGGKSGSWPIPPLKLPLGVLVGKRPWEQAGPFEQTTLGLKHLGGGLSLLSGAVAAAPTWLLNTCDVAILKT